MQDKLTSTSADVVRVFESKGWSLTRLLTVYITSWVNNIVSGVLLMILGLAKFIIIYDSKRKEYHESEYQKRHQ